MSIQIKIRHELYDTIEDFEVRLPCEGAGIWSYINDNVKQIHIDVDSELRLLDYECRDSDNTIIRPEIDDESLLYLFLALMRHSDIVPKQNFLYWFE